MAPLTNQALRQDAKNTAALAGDLIRYSGKHGDPVDADSYLDSVRDDATAGLDDASATLWRAAYYAACQANEDVQVMIKGFDTSFFLAA